ncbi:aminotransferase [Marivirga lumbricoides]|uniref:Aminotransferase n=1 Tax=Marivirga lumbricoides TaxID=1046115 RepID=A0ABQ1ME36_9BACT|nr:aminotransferase [Marivirga lumbricoides]
MIISKANRLASVEEYYLSRKLEEIRVMNANGAKVINLGIGSPDLMPSEETIKALTASAKAPAHHGYQSYRGIPELREAVAQWLETNFHIALNPTAEILPLMGSKEGIMHISMAFLNEGDEVLVPNPGYPTYTSVSKLVGAKIRYYEMKTEGPAIDIENLKQQDLSRVKLMWINFPHMPTGKKADFNLLQQLVALAKEEKFLLCHDNPYSLILNDEPLSIFNVEGAREVAVELNSFSKSHNMAGWRLGWVAGEASYIQTILTVKSNFDSGMFLPVQHAAIKALQNTKEWHSNQNAIYKERKVLAEQLLNKLGCNFNANQAGMFLWAKLPQGIDDAENFIDEILQKAHVFISPGHIFGTKGAGYVRVSLCSDKKVLEEAIQRIDAYITKSQLKK